MEARSCADFSLLFCRFSIMFFGCVIIPMIVIDDLAYQGSVDISINGTSLFMMKTTTVTAVITDLDLLKMTPPIQTPHQNQISDPNDYVDNQFFCLPESLFLSQLQVVWLVVMVSMIFMMWQQKELVCKLQKELSVIHDENNTRRSIIQQIQATLDNQQSQCTSTTYKMAAVNKRVNEISSELVDENTDLESLYRSLKDWKDEWICQSGKIRQIYPDKLPKLPRKHHFEFKIKDQEQQIQKYTSYVDSQFAKIYRYLNQDHSEIIDIWHDMFYVYDALNERQA